MIKTDAQSYLKEFRFNDSTFGLFRLFSITFFPLLINVENILPHWKALTLHFNLLLIFILYDFYQYREANIRYNVNKLKFLSYDQSAISFFISIIVFVVLYPTSLRSHGIVVFLLCTINYFLNLIYFARLRNIVQKLDSPDLIYLGKNLENLEPFFLPDNKLRNMHLLTIGGTGGGKTSAIEPLIVHDINTFKHVVIFAPKEDPDFRDRVYQATINAGRKFVYIDFSNPQYSDFYNPFYGDRAAKIKDKLITSNVWSESFYKTVAQNEVLLSCLWIFYKAEKESSGDFDVRLDSLLEALKNSDDVEGLVSFMKSVLYSEIGYVLTGNSKACARSFYDENAVVWYNIPIEDTPELGHQLAKIIFADYRSLSAEVKNISNRTPGSIFIEECTKFMTKDYMSWHSVLRSSGFSVHLSTQTLSDFDQVDPSLVDQILVNTRYKMILNISSFETSETFAKSIGTKEVEIYTEQVSNDGFTEETGLGSRRIGREFILHSDSIKRLGVGEGYFFTSGNSDVTKLYFDSFFFQVEVYDSLKTSREKSGHVKSMDLGINSYMTSLMDGLFLKKYVSEKELQNINVESRATATRKKINYSSKKGASNKNEVYEHNKNDNSIDGQTSFIDIINNIKNI